MNRHPYLRAYMAGVAVPTIFLLLVATGFTIARYVYNISVPIERVIVFPMAVVPNLWGLWNMFFVSLHDRAHLPIGVHGAVLPLIFAPLGYVVGRLLDFSFPHPILQIFPVGLAVALVAYYLVWKYIVSFFNAELGIA
jgi:hypothetical protein